MGEPTNETSALRQAALEVTRDWSCLKVEMALRASGLMEDGRREPLASIAASMGRSRETVRRARNELAGLLSGSALLDATHSAGVNLSAALSRSAPDESSASGRALRRLLTMTGALPWDEVLVAWARAGGKYPYLPLPTDLTSLRAWAMEDSHAYLFEGLGGTVTVAVSQPEELDQVSQFLYHELRNQPNGLDRGELFDAAERAGLKRTTIATTLSRHPALSRLGPGRWALRGTRVSSEVGPSGMPMRQKLGRPRPTSFSWSDDGWLQIEFSVPRGPSPVIAVPKAVSELVEDREFKVLGRSKPARISVRKARLWGFGPVIAEIGLIPGSRAVVALNLMNSTARCGPVQQKELQG